MKLELTALTAGKGVEAGVGGEARLVQEGVGAEIHITSKWGHLDIYRRSANEHSKHVSLLLSTV